MVQGVIIQNGYIINTNPATGAVIGRVKSSTPEDVDAAVEAAQAAQPRWAGLSLDARVAAVKAAVKQLRHDEAGLARLVTMEMGKVLKEAEEEVAGASDKDTFLDLVAAANEPQRKGSCLIVRQPHGVVAICAPWNFPVDEILLLALPALVAGLCAARMPHPRPRSVRGETQPHTDLRLGAHVCRASWQATRSWSSPRRSHR